MNETTSTGTPENTSGSPEAPQFTPQEQALIEKGQQGVTQVDPLNPPKPESAAPRPDHIPEKFWDAEKGEVRVEALAKSYSELEKTRSQPQQEPTADPAAEPKVGKDGKIEKAEQPSQEQTNPIAEAITAFKTEWDSNGDVTAETADKLEAAGISKEMQAVYLAGIKALQQQTEAEIHGYTGGSESYQQMAAWAGKNLSDAELEAYNSALDNPALRENAVRGMFARFQSAVPSEGRTVTTEGNTSSAGDVYSSREALMTDMKDPRYATSADFREQVEAKLKRSRSSGALGAVSDNGLNARYTFV